MEYIVRYINDKTFLFLFQAEKRFMVTRGIVREARETWEAQQQKLKEIRDRLDRVSRDDTQYLELATQEHKLLQVRVTQKSGVLCVERQQGRDLFWILFISLYIYLNIYI